MKVTLLVWLDALSVSYRSQQQLAYNEEKKRVMYGKARAYHEQLKLLNDKDFLKANVRPTISDSRGEQNQDHAADLEFLQNDREARKRELLLLTQANRGPEQSSRGGTSRGGADTGSVNVMGGCTTRTTCNNPTAKTISSRGVVWQKTRESASGSADLQKMMQDLGAPSAPPAKAVHPAGGGAGAGGGTATSSSSQAGNSGVKGLGAWLNRASIMMLCS
eukprot:g9128.t1